MANEFVDGMDVMAVREAALRAIDRARNESLPTLLEIRAYRYMGHSMSDPGNYRTRRRDRKISGTRPDTALSRTASKRPEFLATRILKRSTRKRSQAVERR